MSGWKEDSCTVSLVYKNAHVFFSGICCIELRCVTQFEVAKFQLDLNQNLGANVVVFRCDFSVCNCGTTLGGVTGLHHTQPGEGKRHDSTHNGQEGLNGGVQGGEEAKHGTEDREQAWRLTHP